MPSLGQRLRDGLQTLVMCEPGASAIDYSRDMISTGSGGHGSHTGSSTPRADAPLADEWAQFFGRALDLLELDIAQLKGTVHRPQPVRLGRIGASASNDRKRRITRAPIYRGRSDAFVAYLEGVSTDLVRKARASRGLDSYGLPKPKSGPPLTHYPIEEYGA